MRLTAQPIQQQEPVSYFGHIDAEIPDEIDNTVLAEIEHALDDLQSPEHPEWH